VTIPDSTTACLARWVAIPWLPKPSAKSAPWTAIYVRGLAELGKPVGCPNHRTGGVAAARC